MTREPKNSSLARTGQVTAVGKTSRTNGGPEQTGVRGDDGLTPARTHPDEFIPSSIDVKSELWKIATGTGSESSRVSALRALADIMGLMRPNSDEFPEGMAALLDAMARGLDSSANG